MLEPALLFCCIVRKNPLLALQRCNVLLGHSPSFGTRVEKTGVAFDGTNCSVLVRLDVYPT